MKNHRWVVAVLAALVVSMPVFAQSANSLQGKQFSKKQLSEMDRKLVRSVKAAREKAPKCIWCGRTITDENQYTKCPQDPDVLCCPGKQTAAPAATCVRCGETYHRGQHCKAADYNALCTTQAEEKQPSSSGRVDNPFFKGGDPHNDANYEKCRTCGEPITDERLYRHCPQDPDIMCLPAPKAAQPAKPAKCRTCGEPVAEGSYRRCPQDPDIYCSPDRSNSETQPADSRYRSNNPNYKGGDPADPANYKTCQWCKQPITDERYGRACPKDPDVHCLPGYDNPNPAPSCYRCGRSFTPGRPCRAKRGKFCAANKKQEREIEKEARRLEEEAAKASRCPKCGEEYNVDVIYHGDPHHCRK